jgi:hypothetical protein
MRGDIPPLPQYAFMAWFSVKRKKHRDNFTFLLLLLLLLLLRWLYSPMRTIASLMDPSQSSPIDLIVPRPHLKFPNC